MMGWILCGRRQTHRCKMIASIFMVVDERLICRKPDDVTLELTRPSAGRGKRGENLLAN